MTRATGPGSSPDCRRAPALLDRVAAGSISDDDRLHAAACPTCGPRLARAGRFDDELRRSIRALVFEDLPAGILELEPERRSGVRPTRALDGLVAVAAAVAILVTATAVALAPGGPGTTPQPGGSLGQTDDAPPRPTPFKTSYDIRQALFALQYACNDGGPIESPPPAPDAPVREAAVCTAPEAAGPFIAAVIVAESRRGAVVEVTIKADTVGEDLTESRQLLAMAIGKGLAAAVADKAASATFESWAAVHIPEVEIGDAISVALRGVDIELSRRAQLGYVLVAHAAVTE